MLTGLLVMTLVDQSVESSSVPHVGWWVDWVRSSVSKPAFLRG